MSAADPILGPGLTLFVEGELEGGEGEISKERGLVSVEERRDTLGSNDGPDGVETGPVVVSRGEEGVVISTL